MSDNSIINQTREGNTSEYSNLNDSINDNQVHI